MMNGIAGTWPMLAVDYGRITRGWMMPFNGMMQKGMMESGRGGACVPARVALSRAHPSFISRAQCVYFWYGNAAARTFGRAHLSAFPPAMTTSKGWQKWKNTIQRVCEGCFQNSTTIQRVCEGCFQNSTPIQRVREGCFQNSALIQRVCEGCFQNSTTIQRVCKGFFNFRRRCRYKKDN